MEESGGGLGRGGGTKAWKRSRRIAELCHGRGAQGRARVKV